ncbi:MAG: BrnA antitoxin family protein [Sphingomicrobium sp.]
MDDSWDPDTAPEIPDEAWDRAQISIGGKVIRKATGTLTKRGRPPIGDVPKQQVTLRLPRDVIGHFKGDGPGWQTRIGEVLARHAARDKRKRA